MRHTPARQQGSCLAAVQTRVSATGGLAAGAAAAAAAATAAKVLKEGGSARASPGRSAATTKKLERRTDELGRIIVQGADTIMEPLGWTEEAKLQLVVQVCVQEGGRMGGGMQRRVRGQPWLLHAPAGRRGPRLCRARAMPSAAALALAGWLAGWLTGGCACRRWRERPGCQRRTCWRACSSWSCCCRTCAAGLVGRSWQTQYAARHCAHRHRRRHRPALPCPALLRRTPLPNNHPTAAGRCLACGSRRCTWRCRRQTWRTSCCCCASSCPRPTCHAWWRPGRRCCC
jgi:hypothetical protein